jgi:hypothetical protein
MRTCSCLGAVCLPKMMRRHHARCFHALDWEHLTQRTCPCTPYGRTIRLHGCLMWLFVVAAEIGLDRAALIPGSKAKTGLQHQLELLQRQVRREWYSVHR